jgi:hypothetical protein
MLYWSYYKEARGENFQQMKSETNITKAPKRWRRLDPDLLQMAAEGRLSQVQLATLQELSQLTSWSTGFHEENQILLFTYYQLFYQH